jgi:branched-chain amino acid transport system ATP-binding protein
LAISIQLQNITKRFGGLVAVNNLSVEVEAKSIHALIGPNGSGKTTMLNLIAGVLKPNDGVINYHGETISNLPPYQIACKGIGRTFQNIKLFASMTAIENVMVGGDSQTQQGFLGFLFALHAAQREEKALREKAAELLNFLGMYHLKDELVKNLPYGRQKVLELGRTLMSNPDLILLDEPAAGLNPSERNEFVAMLDKLHRQGKTLLLIEHNMDVVMSISQKITVLNFGAKIAEGSPRDIQTNDEVIKAYLGEKFKQQKIN